MIIISFKKVGVKVLKIIAKIVKNNKIIGVRVVDASNNIFKIDKSDFHKHLFSNAKITKDFKIISNDTIPTLGDDLSNITLFHGSHSGLKGKISPFKSTE